MSDTRVSPASASDFIANEVPTDEATSPTEDPVTNTEIPSPQSEGESTEVNDDTPGNDGEEIVLASNKHDWGKVFKKLIPVLPMAMILGGLIYWVINHLSLLLLVPAVIILAGAIFVAVLLKCSVKLKKEEEDILPTRGTWYFLWQLANLFGRKWRPMRVSKTDYAAFYRIKAEEEDEQARLAIEAERQRDLDTYEAGLDKAIVAEYQGETYNFTNTNGKGGGGKTPLTALIALCLAIVTRRVVTAIDNNPYGGNLFTWLGAPRRPMGTIRWMSTEINDKKINNFNDFSGPLSPGSEGVQLVNSDELEGTDRYSGEETRSVVTAARQNSIFVVNDTSNNIGGDAVQELLEMSDVLAFPGFLREDKLDGVIKTMRNFAKSYGPLVKHGVSVTIGLKPGETAEDYRARMELPPEAILMGIPYDEQLERFQAIDFMSLSQETRIAVKELVLVLIRVANHVKLHGREVAPLQFTQGRLVPIPSERTPVLSYTNPPPQPVADTEG